MSDAMRRSIGDTIDRQARYRASGLRVAVIPAMAVLFLSTQTIFFEAGGPAAVGLAVAEGLLLLTLVATVWSSRMPTLAWVISRTKTELFRREHYLLLVRAGPYLGHDVHDAVAIRDARIGSLIQADLTSLQQLVPLGSRDHTRGDQMWIDELWTVGPPDCPDDVERMHTYLHYRIRRQALFFQLALDKCARIERLMNVLVKAAVLVAVTAAVIYATLLVAAPDAAIHSTGTALLALTSATMPAICSSALAVQGMYASQRLAISYADTRDELLRHEIGLKSIINEAATAGSGIRFRALALHVESTLTEELRRWVMLVSRPEFEATV